MLLNFYKLHLFYINDKESNIKTLIYLDQNIISDLRNKKLEEMNNEYLITLKRVLMNPNIQVVYSDVTLAETIQIPKDEHMVEHLQVLEELNAKYIDPLNNKLRNEKPIKICIEYLKNLKSFYSTPYPNFATTMDKFSRKISGLPIEQSIEEISKNIIDNTENIMKISVNQINALNENEYEEPMKSAINLMKKNLPKLFDEALQSFNPLTEIDNLPLGPKPFREYKSIKRLINSKITGSELVKEIENIFNQEHGESNWKSSMKDTTENKIIIAYNLMNWAGYYPDDFDKVKKNKDRFRASQNDMQHAVRASIASFLISNDNPFRIKTIASYEYANINTIVCSAESFLKEHFFK